jgi:hypothetical protein
VRVQSGLAWRAQKKHTIRPTYGLVNCKRTKFSTCRFRHTSHFVVMVSMSPVRPIRRARYIWPTQCNGYLSPPSQGSTGARGRTRLPMPQLQGRRAPSLRYSHVANSHVAVLECVIALEYCLSSIAIYPRPQTHLIRITYRRSSFRE